MVKRVLARGQTSDRVDDTEESVQKRLVTFKSQTVPVLEYYQKMSKVIKVCCFNWRFYI